MRSERISSWWLNQHQIQQYAQVKLDHFPRDRGENKKCLKFHHLDVQKSNKQLDLVLVSAFKYSYMIQVDSTIFQAHVLSTSKSVFDPT